MSKTLDTERTEPLFLSGSAITSPNGTTVRTTVAPRTFKREQVEVQNAPTQSVRDDDSFNRNDTFPNYSDQTAAAFAHDGTVPLSEISYWLLWGNQLRVNEGESAFDFPHAKALQDYMNVIFRKYTPKGTKKAVLTPLVQTVSYEDFVVFMETLQELEREAFMHTLDEFVGQYL